MKGLMIIRNIFICFLALVFSGCAEMGIQQLGDCDTGIGPGVHNKGIAEDAIIIVTGDGKKLKYVSPTLSKNIASGAVVSWKIVPSAQNAKIKLCIKKSTSRTEVIPFTNFNSTYTDNNGNVFEHCSEVNSSDVMKGMIDLSKIPDRPGYLEFHYAVFNIDNGSSIDPDGVLYK